VFDSRVHDRREIKRREGLTEIFAESVCRTIRTYLIQHSKGGAVRLLLVGSTGLVGQHVLDQALVDTRVASIVAPIRGVPQRMHPKLSSPQVDYENLDQHATWWQADAVICTLGTTMRAAGSEAAFRRVDFDYPLTVARLAKARGTPTYVLNSAIGADASSRFFYNRVKGELERALSAQGFVSLTLVRPGVIGGERQAFRLGERVMGTALSLFGPLLPRRWRLNPAMQIAGAMLAAALEAQPGQHIIKAESLV